LNAVPQRNKKRAALSTGRGSWEMYGGIQEPQMRILSQREQFSERQQFR